MNPSLQKSYDYLAKTHNTAALELLVETFHLSDEQNRQICIETLLRRESDLSHIELLDLWPQLTESEQQSIGDSSVEFCRFLQDFVNEGYSPRWKSAVHVVRQLSIHGSVPSLIRLAEVASDPRQKREATLAVLDLTSSLGKAARRGSENLVVRRRILDRLVESIQTLDRHRCVAMVDAFLSVTTWTDSVLQSALSENSTTVGLLADRMKTTTNACVIDLSAGWITRKRIPNAILQVIQSRTDEPFRESLLAHVTESPTRQTLRNLKMLNSVAAFQDPESCWREVAAQDQAALIHVFDCLELDRDFVLEQAINLLEQGDQAAAAAISVITRQGSIPLTQLMPEAIELALMLDNDESESTLYQSLLWRLVRCLEHPTESVRNAARKSLENLQAKELFTLKEPLSQSEISRIASVVLAVDPEAEAYVQSELKHAVMTRRLAAVDAAAGLGLIDSSLHRLQEAFENGHLEMKIQIATTLHNAQSASARRWLKELRDGDPGPIRDAALRGATLQEVH